MAGIEPEGTTALDPAALLHALRALRRGDFSARLPMTLPGLDGEIARAFNDVAEGEEAFADELARIRRVVGKEGRLAQRFALPGAGGGWGECVHSVNGLIDDLAWPVNEVARVVGAVARGDLSQQVGDGDGHALRGEMQRIGAVVNTMVEQLSAFASEVSRVAREVGSEGKLGGQAVVPGAAGTWKDLTENVNYLAANLTTQVRAIAEVATAVTKGDLTRSIMVQAQGEVAALKDRINEMIRNLRDTTQRNAEQNWLKSNLERFSRLLQGHRYLHTVAKLVLSELAPLVNAQQGVLYSQVHEEGGDSHLELLATYASSGPELPRLLRLGEGLLGECARDKRRILLDDAPADFIRVSSVLGSAAPAGVIIVPVLYEGETKAVIELASYRPFGPIHLAFIDALTENLGVVFNTIEATMRTEGLLVQSQSLTRELQAQQQALRETNEQLQRQAAYLQKSENLLIGQQEELQMANEQLRDKAEQLALSSRYKSEFLANMSHELRTPLNSLLILAKMLADNANGNLTAKQIEYAENIRAAGTDLLSLISDVLDLAKIESGTVTLAMAPERLEDVAGYVERSFAQLARGKGLELVVQIAPDLPEVISTDLKRLQQILKNLVSNAVKFTPRGRVSLRVERRGPGIAFIVADTGIGIAANKLRSIFEAFQQADGTTSREYGGTGLGLSISEQLATLMGGRIEVESAPGRGSTFTLYLPLAEGANDAPAPARQPANAETAARTPLKSANAPAPAPERARVPELEERKVLIVDDDVRNIFALASALEEQAMTVLDAENGKEALERLQSHPDVDIVLMDLMMPELDGFDTIRIIRGLEEFRDLPIICVTAKAMKGDREACLEAGATDYVAKPVDLDELKKLMARLLRAAPARSLPARGVAPPERRSA